MKPVALIPRAAGQRKPAHGAPCNRCGVCCMATICELGQSIFKRELGPCPALQMNAAGESRCGVVAEPLKYNFTESILITWEQTLSKTAALLIGSGTGCDCRINGEPKNESFYDLLDKWDRDNAVELKRARELWGLK